MCKLFDMTVQFKNMKSKNNDMDKFLSDFSDELKKLNYEFEIYDPRNVITAKNIHGMASYEYNFPKPIK